MNVLELYRRLPRTNCGTCAPKACMPFAVALAKGDATADACPGLTEEQRREIVGGSAKGDWRETVVAGLRAEVAALSLADAAPGIGAVFEAGALRIRCLGRDYLVAGDGAVSIAGDAKPVPPWTKILLLHYARTRGDAPPAGRWVAFADLRSGLVKATSFARECEEPLRELFDRDTAAAERALERIGGAREAGAPAPVAWRVEALPRVPVLVLYWPPEEEFPSKCKVLFDASADRFLDVESLTFLVEGLAKNLEHGPDAPPHD
ncbi:MAG TPA: DUF3786 domain-containing protein [bacterium]